MLNRVIKHDMEEIWAVWRVRRKATSGVLMDPGIELLLEVVEKGEAVPLDDDEDPLREVSSSPNSPARVAGSVISSRRAERSERIF
jgi:hypothetical protein